MAINNRRLNSSGEPTVLTLEQNQAIIQLYRYGISATRVANYFELSPTAVYRKYRQFKMANIEKDLRPTIDDILTTLGFNV